MLSISVDTRNRTTLTIVGAILGLSTLVMTVAAIRYGVPTHQGVGFDAEKNAYAAYSGLLLIAAGVVTFLLTKHISGQPRALTVGLGILFCIMGLDEWAEIHEHLEKWTGIDWQILYAPLFLIGAIAGLLMMRSIPVFSSLCFIAGGSFWVVSQLLEGLQWDGAVLTHPWMVVPEELLETAGSTMVLVALVFAWGTLRAGTSFKTLLPAPAKAS